VWALSDPATIVPMAGAWDGDRFVPAFPFAAGTTYAVLDRAGEGWTERARFSGPVAPQREIEVLAIEPGVAEVPENLLRFAVTFSAPVQEGGVRVRLLGADGSELPGLLDLELWDRSRRRLTVLLEPGRIKRGLVPNLEAGPALQAGSSVTFAVDADLASARRSFTVRPPVRSRVDPASWRVDWPGGGLDDLVVTFDRPMDRALVARCLTATTPGRAALDVHGLRWSWRPSEPWREPALHVDPDLEDLAGNSVRRVFDRDLRRPEDDPPELGDVVVLSAGPAARGARPAR
jgi:hypothetical protein